MVFSSQFGDIPCLKQTIKRVSSDRTLYFASHVSLRNNRPDGSGDVACYYWLHTHDTSGVIHIESSASAKETFTLEQFMAEWEQDFNNQGFPNQLLLKSGWTIWINGHIYQGDLASIPLAKHALITISYNSPNVKPDTTYAWNGQ